MSALLLAGVAVRRGGRPVLADVDLACAPGRLTALIGPNGAGKSTLLAVAAGLLLPAAGTVTLGGTALVDLPRRELARRRAYLPQRAGVDWPLSVERVVALGLTPALPAFGGWPAPLRAAVDRTLADHDLAGLRHRPATALSGGELARVMLARATVGTPELLIVDEPTAGLDPAHAVDAMRRLRTHAAGGCTVVLALHELDLALAHADRVVAVKAGRLCWHKPAAEVDGADLARLYDVGARVLRDADGVAVRFGG